MEWKNGEPQPVKDVSELQRKTERLHIKSVRITIETEEWPDPMDVKWYSDEHHEILMDLSAKREVLKEGDKLVVGSQSDHEFNFYIRKRL